MRFETYAEAEQWILNRRRILVYFEPFQALMNELGNPEQHISAVHVGGTNGKGSTCRFLYDLLKTKYERVGLYTSPQLENMRDRIRINDAWIDEATVLRYVNTHIDLIEKYNLGMVGISTMMMFLWFAEQKVDIAVIEVTMGGRYDTTNVITQPLLSIITSIGMDHMEYLGDTLGQIAWEKAGIIKEGCPSLVGDMDPEPCAVIAQYAAQMNSERIDMPAWSNLESGHFSTKGRKYEIPSFAPYLKHNAVLALAAAERLGIDIHSDTAAEALKQSRWPGRFEIVREQPYVILDGAHNPDGTQALIDAIASFPRPRVAVFTALKDKQGPRMRQMLEEAFDVVITTEFESYRADTMEHLGGTRFISDWNEAIEAARKEADVSGTVAVTGSLYFISAVRAKLKGEGGKV